MPGFRVSTIFQCGGLPYTSMEGPGTNEAISGFGRRRIWEDCVMYKLISIILAAIPFILFLRTIFIGRLRRSQAVSDFRKQIDYLVWIILILIGCGLIYSLGKLILPEGTLYHFRG